MAAAGSTGVSVVNSKKKKAIYGTRPARRLRRTIQSKPGSIVSPASEQKNRKKLQRNATKSGLIRHLLSPADNKVDFVVLYLAEKQYHDTATTPADH
jgi:hypothetical protein